jgi:hypothetical protein
MGCFFVALAAPRLPSVGEALPRGRVSHRRAAEAFFLALLHLFGQFRAVELAVSHLYGNISFRPPSLMVRVAVELRTDLMHELVLVSVCAAGLVPFGQFGHVLVVGAKKGQRLLRFARG